MQPLSLIITTYILLKSPKPSRKKSRTPTPTKKSTQAVSANSGQNQETGRGEPDRRKSASVQVPEKPGRRRIRIRQCPFLFQTVLRRTEHRKGGGARVPADPPGRPIGSRRRKARTPSTPSSPEQLIRGWGGGSGAGIEIRTGTRAHAGRRSAAAGGGRRSNWRAGRAWGNPNESTVTAPAHASSGRALFDEGERFGFFPFLNHHHLHLSLRKKKHGDFLIIFLGETGGVLRNVQERLEKGKRYKLLTPGKRTKLRGKKKGD